METLNFLLQGFDVATRPANLLVALFGAFVGTIVGLLPGLGPINGVALLLPLAFALGLPPETALILLAAWIIDHPRILRSADGVKITLDKIDAHALSNPEVMRADLSTRLGVEVMSYQITALDYINDMARINVFYRKR